MFDMGIRQITGRDRPLSTSLNASGKNKDAEDNSSAPLLIMGLAELQSRGKSTESDP